MINKSKRRSKMSTWYEKTALVLAAIGAINWGLFAIDPAYNLVGLALGGIAGGIIATVVYAVIALCGIWALVKVFK
jgi:uncharacterized membrane protein YuzA (DUF378 family)